ncbi:MAG: hypothetical protein U5R14_01335 [Gemmatimonadota bacterium]|nr:hypothetical protein [Gemmatimonadota bacterium]
MKTKHAYKTPLLALAVAGAVGLGACSDDPVGIDDDDHEEDVEGVELVLNGQVLASFDGDSRTWTGELDVGEGQETAHITVRFVDHDGTQVSPEDDTYLEVDIGDETIAEWEQDTPGEFGGHLHGLAAGETDAVFKLMHGDVGSGHADFETTAVHVHVN